MPFSYFCTLLSSEHLYPEMLHPLLRQELEDTEEMEVEVDAEFSYGSPARLNGLPEDNRPAEDPEIVEWSMRGLLEGDTVPIPDEAITPEGWEYLTKQMTAAVFEPGEE